jgi:hypothetical protein
MYLVWDKGHGDVSSKGNDGFEQEVNDKSKL